MVAFIIDVGYIRGRGFGLAIKAGADRLWRLGCLRVLTAPGARGFKAWSIL
jgi:hypothetical protein